LLDKHKVKQCCTLQLWTFFIQKQFSFPTVFYFNLN
jgi:hypothetical protein